MKKIYQNDEFFGEIIKLLGGWQPRRYYEIYHNITSKKFNFDRILEEFTKTNDRNTILIKHKNPYEYSASERLDRELYRLSRSRIIKSTVIYNGGCFIPKKPTKKSGLCWVSKHPRSHGSSDALLLFQEKNKKLTCICRLNRWGKNFEVSATIKIT